MLDQAELLITEVEEIIGVCRRCGYQFRRYDEDPLVRGLAYCPWDGCPMNYDR